MDARVVDSAQGAWLTVDGRTVLNLCSNDYLGLAAAAELKAAAIHAVETAGVGVGGARSISGTQRLHVQLEQRLAEFKAVDGAMLLSSGFLANLAVLPALVGKGDVIFSDELNHASIVDGYRLSGAHIVRYPHVDPVGYKRCSPPIRAAASARSLPTASSRWTAMWRQWIDWRSLRKRPTRCW